MLGFVVFAGIMSPTSSFQASSPGLMMGAHHTSAMTCRLGLKGSSATPARGHLASSLRMVAATDADTEKEGSEKVQKATDYFKPLVEGDVLESTDQQRMIVGASYLFLGALAAKGLYLLPGLTPETALGVVASIVLGYEFADIGSGVYHWSMDNYGDKDTPIFGTQIEAFQGHHELPWTITYRQFSNNIYKICQASAPFSLAGLLLLDNSFAILWMATAITFINMSQELHKWSHQGPSQTAEWINALQDKGIIITRKSHLAHHRPPFDGNYCIVSGHMNPLLDNIGFFRGLENIVYKATGNKARCWTNERLLADKVQAIGIKRTTTETR